MANIVSNAEAAAFMGISATDPALTAVIPVAESIAADDCGYESFSAPSPDADCADSHEYAGVGPYYLRFPNPHGTLTVDGNAAPQYLIVGRRLEFASEPTLADTVWGRVSFAYRYGWTNANAPQKLKSALLSLISFLYSKRNSEGISEFSQGELRIKYADAKTANGLPEIYSSAISSFRIVDIFSDSTATRYMP